ncbi:unnamed protein product [Mytilus edulis]|uniref:Uncharacterized protein n=1 Tax=Mytilus edulis TaxID=6550 RepID=A0A8S3PZ13_MYTED|nr:unnamed protein product [Mytilus edulis]
MSDQSIHLFNIDLSNNLMKTLDWSNMIVQDKFFCKIDFSHNDIQGVTNKVGILLNNEVDQNGGDILLQNMREVILTEWLSDFADTIEDYQKLFSSYRGTYDLKNTTIHCDCRVGRFLKYCPFDFYQIYKSKENELLCGSPSKLDNVSVLELP